MGLGVGEGRLGKATEFPRAFASNVPQAPAIISPRVASSGLPSFHVTQQAQLAGDSPNVGAVPFLRHLATNLGSACLPSSHDNLIVQYSQYSSSLINEPAEMFYFLYD